MEEGPAAPDSALRFEAVAAGYARHRPGYPRPFLGSLLSLAGIEPGSGAEVVDLGCGTGISSRALAALGLRVTGVDPGGAMLAEARAAGGGPRYATGTAEASGLPDRCCDLVTAAQCFHWFDPAAALREIRRLLRPGGRCAVFWNHRRAGAPAMDAYEDLLRRRCPEYGELFGGARVHALDLLRSLHPPPDGAEASLDHEDLLDRSSFLGRVRSASYVARGVEDREGFERELLAVFDAHEREGRVPWSMRAEGLVFRP